MQRLTPKQLKEYREAQWLAQGKRCALTGYTISLDQAVVDHDHATGRIRGVLHRGVNSLLGKIENEVRQPLVNIAPETEVQVRAAMVHAGLIN